MSKSATDAQNFSIERWNYKWTGAYGSENDSVADPSKKGSTFRLVLAILLRLNESADFRGRGRVGGRDQTQMAH